MNIPILNRDIIADFQARQRAGESLEALALEYVDLAQQLTGRQCGSCTLCCKALPIDSGELKKPAGQWCKHCTPGKGCNIYETRPDFCKGFGCLWLLNADFGDEWKPSKSKIVIRTVGEKDGGISLHFTVDPVAAGRWREEPYYSQIKAAAFNGLNAINGLQHKTVVDTGKQIFVILPREDVETGRKPHLLSNATGDPFDWKATLFDGDEQLLQFVAVLDRMEAALASTRRPFHGC